MFYALLIYKQDLLNQPAAQSMPLPLLRNTIQTAHCSCFFATPGQAAVISQMPDGICLAKALTAGCMQVVLLAALHAER